MSAAGRWRTQLEAWAIPEDLLAASGQDPYAWPVELWERRREVARHQPEPETTRILRRLLPPNGSLLDIGAGTGRASLPLAREGHRLVAVERNPGMAAALRRAAEGLQVEVMEGSWPEVASRVPPAEVVMAAHVVYDVADIVPFLQRMHDHASRAVVLELTGAHPWADLAPYYRALHHLDRPAGPTVDDLVAVLEEDMGVAPHLVRWSRSSGMYYQSWEELLSFMGPRLVLPQPRWGELRELLEAEVMVDEEGQLRERKSERTMATVWWERSP